jgi:hypothetical protein
MYKKFLFLTSFVLVLSLAAISYGADARMIKLDMNYRTDNNDANTQYSFTKFSDANSGSEVNNVVIDLVGSLNSARRADPCGMWAGGVYYPRAGERIYRDFIFGITGNAITISLYGLGVNRDCNVTIWAFDNQSTEGERIAKWYGNGTYLFDANFIGGSAYWPGYEAERPQDLYKHAWHNRATTDYLGRLILTSIRGPNSPASQPFAFANALQVEPEGTFVETKYAQRPVPFDGKQNVPVNTLLKWRKGAPIVKHDLYLGTDETAVTNATRASHPGVLAALDQAPDANKGYDPYGATGFLKLDTTYYWCVDENNTNGQPLSPGEVWSFNTLPYYVVDNFDSYPGTEALFAVWTDYWTNGTCAEVFTEQTIIRSVQSMKYEYKNNLYPYYSEANATVAALGLDPDWSGMEAKALSLWFYGTADNDANEQMYLKLVDSDTPVHIAKVEYRNYGDMNNVRLTKWQEWNIPLADFAVAAPNFNLHKVAKIVIGFNGEGTGNDVSNDPNTVYFEDFRIYATRCVLAERSADIALVDYAPGGTGDCTVDNQELLVMANTWLVGDEVMPTKDPCNVNLVLYYPLNEGDGNKIYPTAGSGGPSGDLALWTGTMYNSSTTPPGNRGTSWSTDHAPGIGGSHCLNFNGDYGTRVQCGTYGQLRLGIGNHTEYSPPDVNKMTLSCWTKFSGPRSWDSYLFTKSMGLLGKRGGWSDATMVWMLECTAGANTGLGLRHYVTSTTDRQDLYTAAGRMLTELNKWAHIAATFDGNTARLYINGGQVNSGLWRLSNGLDPNIFFTIGETMDQNAWGGNSVEAYNGYIDEVRIYNRVLEPNEIAYLADSTPEDGYLQIPVPSLAEVYKKEPVGQQMVNFKDFALVTNKWLAEDLYP